MYVRLTSAQSIAVDCGQKPIEQIGVLRSLHMDGEAEVFAGLFGDGGDRGDRRAGRVAGRCP